MRRAATAFDPDPGDTDVMTEPDRRYQTARTRLYAALFDALPSEPRAASASAASAAPAPDAGEKPEPARKRPVLEGAPQTPWQLRGRSWVEITRRVIAEIGRDRVMSVAGGVTFFGLLALFPAITALVSIYGLFTDPATMTGHLAALERVLPPEAVGIISGQVERIASAPGSALSLAGIVALGVALYSANGGMKALIEALNVAWFETEKRGFLALNAVAMMFTLGGIALIVLMIGVIAVIPVVLKYVYLGASAEWLVTVIRWPLMLTVLMLALACIYRWGPSVSNPCWHWITPGAIFAGFGLIVSSMLFSWYVTNFGNYNEVYGSLGAVIVLMMWLWITSMVIMIGAEINSEVERQLDKENGLTIPDDPVAKADA